MFMPSIRHALFPTVLGSVLSLTIPLAAIACEPPPQAAISRTAGQFPVDRVGIGGIKLDMSDAQVRRILGKPQQIKNEATNCCGTLQHWRYANLEVSFIVDDNSKKLSVYQVITKSAKVATREGIRVGDRRSKVLSVYGNGGTSESSNILLYTNDQQARSFVLKFNGDRLIEILASTQLN